MIARFVGIASAIAIALYYLPDYLFLEKMTGEHSAILMGLIGIKATVWTQGNTVFLNQFEIERMCTGVQVIAVFLGLIVALPKLPSRKESSRLGSLRSAFICEHCPNSFRDLAAVQWNPALVSRTLSDWPNTWRLFGGIPCGSRRPFHA